jgi:uncharacterized protein (DUF4415 family)
MNGSTRPNSVSAMRWFVPPSARDDLRPMLPKKLIALHLDPDIIERFRATGPGWQSRINAVLRE